MAEVESPGAKGQYAITAEWAKRKAKLLVELAGGKTALQHMHALDAVAMGCGFRDWRELGGFIARVEAEGTEAAGVTQTMLADNLHVDEPTLAARMRNQEAAVRKYVKCSPGQVATIVRKWSLTDYAQKHGARTSVAPSPEPRATDSTLAPSQAVVVAYRKRRAAHNSDTD
jgi:hypothetical protein